ncbi:hypothetical protein [Pseudonocardia alni]|uniref:hypothetical protein n=1 Tax=Pseudonocardia alni TaxID=33907 RepID=UPI0033D60315
MAAALLDGMGRRPEVDLAVVAHATPDLDCRLSVVTYLADALPGQPTTFTITDCGDAPVHTLLRVVGAHARRHGARRALALLFDQATLPYDTGRNLAGDAAVALLLDDADGGGEVGLSDVLDVPPEGVPSVLDAFLANLPPSATVVAGPGLAGVVDPGHPGRVVRVRPGFPATGGVTAALRAGADDIVLLDHELGRRELRVCRLRWGG